MIVKKFIAEGRLPHLLLYGPPGTGKTSTANALCADIYGPRWRSTGSVLELNASDERGIDVVREQIKTFAETMGLSMQDAKYKLVILDEADAMTSAAQNALRRVMEKHVKHVRFIIMCNYANQIIPALQSRCTKFRFSPLNDADLLRKLKEVCGREQVSITSDAEQSIVRLAKGDMRRIMNVLQACAAAAQRDRPIDALLVHAVTATAHPADIDSAFAMLLQEASLRIAVKKADRMLQENAMALGDLATFLFERVCQYEMPQGMRTGLLKALADCEYKCASCHAANESVQLAALAGAFFKYRQSL